MSAFIKPAFLFILFFLPAWLSGQTDRLSVLKEQLSAYLDEVPREEIYIHTDREEYIAGEEIFFAIYILDRQSFKISSKSKLAYVELRNEQDQPVVQLSIFTGNGTGNGNFRLPDTLNTGFYTLVAYTNWMKNFLPANCFTKDLIIYNALKDFRPGTKLVKEQRRYPVIQKRYTGWGTKIDMDRSNNDSLKIGLLFNSNKANNHVYTIIQTHGNINYAGTHSVLNNSASFSVPSSSFTPGINHLAVFNEAGIPIGERLFFTPFPDQSMGLNAPDNCKIREKINLSISGKIPAAFSISVSPGAVNPTGIRDYLIFGTEFGLSPPDTLSYENHSEKSLAVIDSILAETTSNWIDWSVITSGEVPVFEYPMESEYHYISGRLMSELKNVTVDSAPRVTTRGFQYRVVL